MKTVFVNPAKQMRTRHLQPIETHNQLATDDNTPANEKPEGSTAAVATTPAGSSAEPPNQHQTEPEQRIANDTPAEKHQP